jgi:uncharacterized protein
MTPPAETATRVAAVLPTANALSRLRPLSATDVSVTADFWASRLEANRARTIPAGFGQLEAAGTLHNFKLAAGSVAAGDGYRALGVMFDKPFPFLDSDVYKWLEAAGWELGRSHDPTIAAMADEAIGVVESAQRPDGYLNTFVQVLTPGAEYRDLEWGHELYCIGHLVQAAIAWHRALGNGRLLLVAERAVASVERAIGPEGREGIDGHPEIEMALVELYRTTGDRRYLDLAATFVERRGHGRLKIGRFGAQYWQDHAPVREAPTVTGHAVRQLYLDCGAVDVAVEVGEETLLDAVLRRWRDMVATRSYLTGGVGSRHRDEAFGDPYELPPDRAYTETCAAIARVMLGWRLLLATGDQSIADDIERTLFNAVLPGLSLDGTRFFYTNPLQRRSARADGEQGDGERATWYACACCPPNLMRTIASMPQLIATSDGEGVQLHQFASAEIRTEAPDGGPIRLTMATDYPWSGGVDVTIVETPETPWTLTIRIPGWSTAVTITAPDDHVRAGRAPSVEERRQWAAGDTLSLTLEMPVRVATPHPRVDAVRGCVALERGPLVYCIETDDLPSETELEDVAVHPAVEPQPVPRGDVGDGIVGLSLPAAAQMAGTTSSIVIGAVPYFAWGNRAVEAMRVWIPTDPSAPTTRAPV